MRRAPSLRARLAISFAAFGTFVILALSLAIAYGAHDVARSLIDQTLAAEMEDYVARRQRNPASLPPAAIGLRGYVAPIGEDDERQPPTVRVLPIGYHTVDLEGTSWRVAVAERDGWRYVILFDETRQKRRETRFLAWIAGGALIVLMLAWTGVWWLAGRALAPLSRLTQTIAAADPETPPSLDPGHPPAGELERLADAFAHFTQRIAAFVARERAFTADASHELRTPLAVIRNAAELLASDPTLSPSQHARAERIERAAKRMGEVLEALLLLAREESAQGRCDARAIAREVIERQGHLCEGRGLEVGFIAAAAPFLPLSAPLFSILVGNLLRNACAHAMRRVSVTLDEDSLCVLDDGPGMSADALAFAHQRYWRGPESQGAGIGLALVSRICELAGFTLNFANLPEGGFMVEVKFSSHSTNGRF